MSKLISLRDVEAILIEDGLQVTRLQLVNALTHIIGHLGLCYEHMLSTVSYAVTVPSHPGIINKPEGIVSITKLELGQPKVLATTGMAEDGSPVIMACSELPSVLPLSFAMISRDVIIFNKELHGKLVNMTISTVPTGDDGWPLMHELLQDPIELYIKKKRTENKMFNAGQLSKPTNNMIIATKNDLSKNYHTSVSYARSEISRENSINL